MVTGPEAGEGSMRARTTTFRPPPPEGPRPRHRDGTGARFLRAERDVVIPAGASLVLVPLRLAAPGIFVRPVLLRADGIHDEVPGVRGNGRGGRGPGTSRPCPRSVVGSRLVNARVGNAAT